VKKKNSSSRKNQDEDGGGEGGKGSSYRCAQGEHDDVKALMTMFDNYFEFIQITTNALQ